MISGLLIQIGFTYDERVGVVKFGRGWALQLHGLGRCSKPWPVAVLVRCRASLRHIQTFRGPWSVSGFFKNGPLNERQDIRMMLPRTPERDPHR